MVEWNFLAVVVLFCAAAVTIAGVGVMITGDADRLADKTRLGEALVGGMLLGMATSLSGSVVSVTAALDGRASLAFSNGVGGIAVQTAFLSIADILTRRVNLEHASADLSNVLQAALLTFLLSTTIVTATTPEVTFFGVHPVSFALPVFYLLGLQASARLRNEPMWQPVKTSETRDDAPDREELNVDKPVQTIAIRFAILAIILGIAGWFISKSAGLIADRSGLSETIVGTMMTAIVTSLPELVTTLAAVRRGALQLAVGGIIGGNAFDVLFLAAADVAYRPGSLYHAVGNADLSWVGIGLAMTSVLLLGLIIRQRRGPGGIGFESVVVLLIYFGAVLIQLGSR